MTHGEIRNKIQAYEIYHQNSVHYAIQTVEGAVRRCASTEELNRLLEEKTNQIEHSHQEATQFLIDCFDSKPFDDLVWRGYYSNADNRVAKWYRFLVELAWKENHNGE